LGGGGLDGRRAGRVPLVRLALTTDDRGGLPPMRLLLIDHGSCDPPTTRVHPLRSRLASEGIDALVCGPASVSNLLGQTPGLHGIHLLDIAAANNVLLKAVRDGSAAAFLTAASAISPRLLGLLRETARQSIAEAVDGFDPEVILVLHAGILADLAIETGVPVAVHVAAADLAAATGSEAVRDSVAAAIGSAEAVAAEDAGTAARLAAEWLDDGEQSLSAIEIWPLSDPDPDPDPGTDASIVGRIRSLCERALGRRQG